MAGTEVRYDHPNCIVRREERINNLLGLASTTMQKIMFYQTVKVKRVKSMVVTAGTNTVAGVTINNGTTSVGTITHGTDAALTVHDSGVLDVTVAANSYIDLTGLATSATMVNSYVIEYEVLPSAVFTA